MLRFLRNLLLTLIVIALVGAIVIAFLGSYFINEAEEPLTKALIAKFGPGDDDDFNYVGQARFFPLRVEITDLYVKADALNVEGSTYSDARVDVGKITVDFWPLVQDDEVIILDVEGRAFEGRLTNENLAEYFRINNDHVRDLTIAPYNERCRIVGRIGVVDVVPMRIIGDWKIDDRNVATMVDRDYLNPDSPVPPGMIDFLESQVSFDVRIRILDEELSPEEISYGSNGLYIKASQAD